MAEMSVPAWPMPIHQTKLVMSKAQPTGMFNPHTPTPRRSSSKTDTRKIASSNDANPNISSQPRGVRRVRTMALIWSVTEA